MSTIQTFSRLALKQFCALLEGVAEERGLSSESSGGDLEAALWTKIQAGNPAAESIRVPYPLLKKSLRKLKIELPYMPTIINYNIGCSALKVSGGLYLPCCGACEEESAYCAACAKHELKYGVMEDRGDVGTYSDPTDKHEISFGTWLAKNEKTVEDVYEALASEGFGLVIPPQHLTVNSKRIVKDVKARKGRPKAAKKEVTEDSDSDTDAKPVKPKKVKKSSSTDSELFATVVVGLSEESKAGKPKKAKSPKGSDAEEAPVKVKKAKSPKGSDAEEAPVKVKKAKSPKGSDAEEETPVKAKKAKSPKGSDAETPVKVKKAKSPKGSDAEEAPVKVKKAKSPKGSDADSDEEKPKKSKSEKPKSDDKKAKKAKSPKGSDAEEEKPNKPKADKVKKVKSDDKKEKKAKSENSDMSARFGAELTVETYVPSGFDGRQESFGEEDEAPEIVWVQSVAYNLREGKLLADTETGEIVGHMEEGKGVLDDGNGSDW